MGVPGGVHRQSDVVYEELRRLIIRTELPPGSLIEEASLMARLDAGRTPLREALQRLVQEDLIRNVPRRGYFVTDTTAADLFRMFEVRLSVECLSARLAAERATDAHLAEFADLLRQGHAGIADGNEDLTWNIGIDEWFHRLLARASENAYLVAAINRYYAMSVRVLYLSHVRLTLVRDEIGNFQAMFEAVEAHDPARAEAAMRNHLTINPMTMLGVRPPSVRRTEEAAAPPAAGSTSG